MTSLLGLTGICWGIIFGVVGLTYVPQYIDGFFWDFALRVGYVLAVCLIGGALAMGIALLEVKDSPHQGETAVPE